MMLHAKRMPAGSSPGLGTRLGLGRRSKPVGQERGAGGEGGGAQGGAQGGKEQGSLACVVHIESSVLMCVDVWVGDSRKESEG
jgi:hypothetical protein